jgi:hypothetical protein
MWDACGVKGRLRRSPINLPTSYDDIFVHYDKCWKSLRKTKWKRIKNMGKYTFFYRGPFSQWYRSAPFEIDGISYNTAEQWMMAQKARLFNDEEALEKILATSDPACQKILGRNVKDFKKEVWEEIEINGKPRCWNYVYQGNWAKFVQNPDLLDLLFSTAGTKLVETSHTDEIWGVGLDEHDPRIFDESKWLGTNWLGEVLTKLREDLMAEKAS